MHSKVKIITRNNFIIALILILLPLMVTFLQISNKNSNLENNLSPIENPILKTSPINQMKPEYFDYYKNITIDKTKVSGSHLNFPVLISLLDSDLHDHAQVSGNDIVFFSITDSQWLDHEIELYERDYNSTHAQLIAWVRLPSISYMEDTLIMMYFGNSTMGSEQNLEGVWDENYVMVQHLNDSSDSELDDSTINKNDVSSHYGSPNYNVVGKIGNAVDLDGDDEDDSLAVADSDSLDIASHITMSAWVKLDTTPSYDKIIVKNQFDVDPWNAYSMGLSESNGYFRMELSEGTQYSQQSLERDISISTSMWYYISVSYDQDEMRICVNGGSEYNKVIGPINIANSGEPLTIGGEIYKDEYIDGIIDEVRISKISRSHDWSITEYNNQQDPSSLYSLSESVRLDFSAPSVIINPSLTTGPYGQYQFLEEVEINATISDIESGVLKAIAMINGDEPFNITMNLVAGEEWTCKWDNISLYTNGYYTITIWAINNQGYINEDQYVIISIDNSPLDEGGGGGGGDDGEIGLF